MFTIPITDSNKNDILNSNCHYCNNPLSNLVASGQKEIAIVEDGSYSYLLGYVCPDCENLHNRRVENETRCH